MSINSLKLIGKTSSEIYILRYPNTLLDFCDFDFSVFAEGAIDICNEALKTGSPDYDRISDLRRDIQSAHCYIEHNIRTTYEKIVFDCWIDFVCRRDNIGVTKLWDRYIRCKTPFEKVIFARLSEFRYNRAQNEWLNIIRIQDYAKTKLDFIFTNSINRIEDAAARRNYFDLIFTVTASEMGCRTEDLGVTKLFSVGRIPPAPFFFPNISKDIVRHILPNFDYADDYSDIGEYTDIADQVAMDAFSRMKAGLPQELEKVNIPGGQLEKYNEKIYMPCSLKAAIDLEIDVLIEDGSWLSRCKSCKRFFLRNREHPEEYCSRYVHGGKTCLQIYEEEHPRPTMTPELEERCRAVTNEVYSRVDKTMSVKEYDSWHLYLEAMINKVKNGEILPSELENFLDYSLEVDITKSHPIVEVPKKEVETSKERVVKPFVPERISRSDISAPLVPETEAEDETVYESLLHRRTQPKEGFFTSPAFQRQKSERAPISHIIRGGESMGESYDPKPDPAGFTPFGQTPPERPVQAQQASPAQQQTARTPIQLPVKEQVDEDSRRRTPREELRRLEERIEEENRLRREQAERARSAKGESKPFFEFEPSAFTEEPPAGRNDRGSRNDRNDLYDRRERNDRAENDNTASETGRWGAELAERRAARDSYPQSRRERERSQRQQEQRRQRDLDLAGYGDTFSDELDRELDRRGGARSRDRYRDNDDNDNRNDRNIRADRREQSGRVERADYSDRERAERFERNDSFEEPDLDRFDNIGWLKDRYSTERDDRYDSNPRYSESEDAGSEDDIPDVPDNSGREPEETAPRRRVVRKNAAALSAYGKMAGTAFSGASPFDENIPQPKPEPKPQPRSDIDGSYDKGLGTDPDTEPYDEIGNIFEVLEKSQSRMEREHRRLTDDDLTDAEPSAERERSSNRRTRRSASGSVPTEVTRENAPEGFWTEERNLFRNTRDDDDNDDNDDQPERTDAPKEKKPARSNKNKRLLDTIMREPDDNPNFRK